MVARYIVSFVLVTSSSVLWIAAGPPTSMNYEMIVISLHLPVLIAFTMPRFRVLAALAPQLLYLLVFGIDDIAYILRFTDEIRWLIPPLSGVVAYQLILAGLGSFFGKAAETDTLSVDGSFEPEHVG